MAGRFSPSCTDPQLVPAHPWDCGSSICRHRYAVYLSTPFRSHPDLPTSVSLSLCLSLFLQPTLSIFFLHIGLPPLHFVVLKGFGAAILWIALGAYVTKASTPDTVGKNNGVFWGVFQFSNVLGNLGAYFVFNVRCNNTPAAPVLWVCMCACVVLCVCVCMYGTVCVCVCVCEAPCHALVVYPCTRARVCLRLL